MEHKNQSRYWDKKEAQKELHISQSTLEKWMQQGLPFYKVGRKVLFRPEEVDAWLQQHQVSNKPDLQDLVNGVIKKLRKGGELVNQGIRVPKCLPNVSHCVS